MTSILQAEPIGKVVVGVDTRRQRPRQPQRHRRPRGYEQLTEWAAQFGQVLGLGVEDTGSYGAGSPSHLRRHGHKVSGVNRPDRRVRRQRGKSDPSTRRTPPVQYGHRDRDTEERRGHGEMTRHTKIARDGTVTSAMASAKRSLRSLARRWLALDEEIKDRTDQDRVSDLP